MRVMQVDVRFDIMGVLGRTISAQCGFFFSSRRRHTRLQGDWSSDVCSSDLHVYALRRWIERSQSSKRHVKAEARLLRACAEIRNQFTRIIESLDAYVRSRTEQIGRASCRERV